MPYLMGCEALMRIFREETPGAESRGNLIHDRDLLSEAVKQAIPRPRLTQWATDRL